METPPHSLLNPRTRRAAQLHEMGSHRNRNRSPWRSLDELAQTDEFKAWLEREFPAAAAEWSKGFERREFLRIMGASFALLGVGACSRPPQQKIVPYVQEPEEIVPGQPLFFATAMPLNGFGTGILVESNEGRPTKIEGNPSHPASLGSSGIFEQAAILQLYDPDRSRTVVHRGQIATWQNFLSHFTTELERHLDDKGARLRLLTEPVTSPSLASQLKAFLQKFPNARWHQWNPLYPVSLIPKRGNSLYEPISPEFRLESADVIVSFASDFLFENPDRLRLARAFAQRRKFEPKDKANYLYVAEPSPSLTGSMAEERLPIESKEIGQLVIGLAARLGIPAPALEPKTPAARKWLDRAADDLKDKRGKSVVIVGMRHDPMVHEWVHRVNAALGNIGKTIIYRKPAEAEPVDYLESLKTLCGDLRSNRADSLILVGTNPVFDAPADLKFSECLQRTKFSAHLGLYEDETSERCEWHLPQNHFLESWSDIRAADGTASIIQPLIAPLFGGFSAHQLFSAALGRSDETPYETVRAYWQKQSGWIDFEEHWRQTLNDGLIAGTQSPIVEVSIPNEAQSPPTAKPGSGNVELVFFPDPNLWDGQFANNAWLQELPRPFSKATWDNPALISPRLAELLGLQNGDCVEIENDAGRLELPIWIQPGQAESTVSLHLGGGRRRAGQVGNAVGFDTYRLRSSQAYWSCANAKIRKTGSKHPIASTQLHHSMEGRDFLRLRAATEFDQVPAQERSEEPKFGESFYNPGGLETATSQWGMVINLNTCIGCNACIIACQSENNIPVVGKDQVALGREMHWIRVDRYFQGDPADPLLFHQPVPCMHCENAPCELVCPVEATLHSAEGLNQQVYNRCIGTRYCSNNCPYKVRRFNFFQYSDTKTPSAQLKWNPQVTVRTRGVMEKCSYCIQRIRAVQIAAEGADRRIKDGEIVPACAQACPTEAIVFGDVADPASRVSQLKGSTLNYSMLGELNTRPRTSYLAKVIMKADHPKGTS